MNKVDIIKKYAREDEAKLLLSQVLDKLEEAEAKNILKCTKFLNEHQRELVEKVLLDMGHKRYCFFGWYPCASRNVLIFLPDYLEPERIKETDICPLAFIRVEYITEKNLSHRDFLGSLMVAGVQRETVGDILPGENSCDIVVIKEVLPYLLANFELVGRVKVKTAVVQAGELQVPAEKYELVKDTVASLRLDSVVSAGFAISREKAAEYIKAGRVLLGFLGCSKTDRFVAEGEVITLRGTGKIRLEQIGPQTKKGRTALVIKKYI